MRHIPAIVASILVLATGAACGSGGTTPAVDPGPAPDVAPDVAEPDDPGPSPDEGSPEDVRTDPGTTGHPHPHWPGVTWTSFVPAVGERATFTVTSAEDPEGHDVPVRLIGPVPMRIDPDGATWSSLLFGTYDPRDGMGVYFDLSTPWTVSVKGVERFLPDQLYVVFQVFESRIDIPLDLPAGETRTFSTRVHSNWTGTEKTLGMMLDVRIASYGAACPEPFAQDRDCLDLRFRMYGEFAGGESLDGQVVLHPTQHLVSWINAPAYSSATVHADGWD